MMKSSFFALFICLLSGAVVLTILLLIAMCYDDVNVGEEVDFELNGEIDSGKVEYIKGDFIYVITKSNPDSYTVITYENIL